MYSIIYFIHIQSYTRMYNMHTQQCIYIYIHTKTCSRNFTDNQKSNHREFAKFSQEFRVNHVSREEYRPRGQDIIPRVASKIWEILLPTLCAPYPWSTIFKMCWDLGHSPETETQVQAFLQKELEGSNDREQTMLPTRHSGVSIFLCTRLDKECRNEWVSAASPKWQVSFHWVWTAFRQLSRW